MKYKEGEIVKITGVYRETTLEGIFVAELICIKNELFPQPSHPDNYYIIKTAADGSDSTNNN